MGINRVGNAYAYICAVAGPGDKLYDVFVKPAMEPNVFQVDFRARRELFLSKEIGA